MMDQTIHLQHADCLVRTYDFGETSVNNICTGVARIVPWGSMDYLAALGMIGFAIALLASIVGAAIAIARD